jgi:hypothetical protein
MPLLRSSSSRRRGSTRCGNGTRHGGGVGKGGTGSADGKQVAQGHIDATMPYRFSGDGTFDVGEDTGTPVSEEYEVPFKFTGQIEKLVVDLGQK